MDAVNLSEKYIFLDLRSWEINIARTARRLGVSRNTVRHLQSLSSEEVLQQKRTALQAPCLRAGRRIPSYQSPLHFQQSYWRLLAGTLSGLSARLREDRPQLCPVHPEEAPHSSGQIIIGTTPPRSGSPVRHIHNP